MLTTKQMKDTIHICNSSIGLALTNTTAKLGVASIYVLETGDEFKASWLFLITSLAKKCKMPLISEYNFCTLSRYILKVF